MQDPLVEAEPVLVEVEAEVVSEAPEPDPEPVVLAPVDPESTEVTLAAAALEADVAKTPPPVAEAAEVTDEAASVAEEAASVADEAAVLELSLLEAELELSEDEEELLLELEVLDHVTPVAKQSEPLMAAGVYVLLPEQSCSTVSPG